MAIQNNSFDSTKIHIYRDKTGALKAKIHKKEKEYLIRPIKFFPFTNVDNCIGLCPIGVDGKIQEEIAIIYDYVNLNENIKKLIDEELNKTGCINQILKIYSIKQIADKWDWDVETDKGQQIFGIQHLGDIYRIKNKIIIKDNKRNIFQINSIDELDSKSKNLLEICI